MVPVGRDRHIASTVLLQRGGRQTIEAICIVPLILKLAALALVLQLVVVDSIFMMALGYILRYYSSYRSWLTKISTEIVSCSHMNRLVLVTVMHPVLNLLLRSPACPNRGTESCSRAFPAVRVLFLNLSEFHDFI